RNCMLRKARFKIFYTNKMGFNYGHQFPGRVKYACAMGKSGVCGARINKIRKAKLLNPPQTLKGPCLNDVPKRILKFIVFELDKIVNRITDALRFI
ncbi:MAG TPA: hypothetical protein VFW37_13085, partial [Alphaproteobacteria bacterium]|nr:hypothetical protein [Alphaproteobacteria bacterium]